MGKFKKRLIEQKKALQQNWDSLTMQQKMFSFDSMWEGKNVPNIKGLNFIKGKLPGQIYKKIFEVIKEWKNCWTTKKLDPQIKKDIESLLLKKAYAYSWGTRKKKHLTEEKIKQYKEF
jgi:hypothetical protein